ncbi:MAG: hypothetical protein ACLFUS_05430 [Candidatus Sumerlaeia bacterium]
MAQLQEYLDDLEQAIDPETEDAIRAEWKEFIDGEHIDRYFDPERKQASEFKLEWPKVSVNETLEDYDMMALQQYAGVADILRKGAGKALTVRCNYGTGIMSSLFGAKLFRMSDASNTLPTTLPLEEEGAIARVLDAGVPDLEKGFGKQVFEMGERFAEIARRYPKIGKYVTIYHPDTQGPLDICELICGSQLFYSFYEDPGAIHQLLDLICETYIAFMRKWEKIVPFNPVYNAHWSFHHKGKIVIRDDSAMNLSPDLFDEFVRPYDQRLLDEFDGGVIHFCGRGDHYIKSMCEMRGVYGIAMSQPHLNDMEEIYRNTVDKGIPLFDFNRDWTEDTLKQGREMGGWVQVQ